MFSIRRKCNFTPTFAGLKRNLYNDLIYFCRNTHTHITHLRNQYLVFLQRKKKRKLTTQTERPGRPQLHWFWFDTKSCPDPLMILSCSCCDLLLRRQVELVAGRWLCVQLRSKTTSWFCGLFSSLSIPVVCWCFFWRWNRAAGVVSAVIFSLASAGFCLFSAPDNKRLIAESRSRKKLNRKFCAIDLEISKKKITFSFLKQLSSFYSQVIEVVPTSSKPIFLFFLPLMQFFHPVSKKCYTTAVRPQSPLWHRSLPTSSSCYCGHSLLVLPATAPFPVLEGKRVKEGWQKVRDLMEREKKRGKKWPRSREREREHICQNSSKALGEAKKAARCCSWSRWSECVRLKKGGLMGRKVREALLFGPSQRERERGRGRVGERFIIHVCEIRIKLNRLLGIIPRDSPTWG